MRDGALDNPRTAELVFHGKTLKSRATVLVKQAGDKFRDVNEMTVSDAVSSEDGTVVIIKDAQVSALTSKGFVVANESSALYVLSSCGSSRGKSPLFHTMRCGGRVLRLCRKD